MTLRLPSPSFMVASLALAVALGGGVGYAAGQLPKNSVGSKQLKKEAVTTAKLKPGAVTGAQVADGTVAGSDLAAGAVTGPKVSPNSLGGAQIDESTLNIPPRPSSLFLTGTDFLPRESTFTFATSGQGDLQSPSGGSFAANLHLPQGATVTSIKLFYIDNGASDIEVYTGRFGPAAGDYAYSAPTLTEGASVTVRTMVLTSLANPPGTLGMLLALMPAGINYKIIGAQIDYQ